MSDYLLGIDFGGTNIKIGCFDKKLNLIGKHSVPTGENINPEAIVEKFYAASNELLAQNKLSMDDVCAVGVGSPGIIDANTGIVMAAPNLPLFLNVPFRDLIFKKMGKPATVENDANVACWAEYVIGAASQTDHMIMLTLGTGVGGGIICDGRLIHGPAGGAAELGHIVVYPDGRLCGCGQRGCIEAYSSASSTARRAQEAVESGATSSLSKVLNENGVITCKDVFAHAANGDDFANEIVEGTAKALALVCVTLANTTDPQSIVFAGGMIAAGDALMDRIRHHYKDQIGPLYGKEKTVLCFAALGEDAGIIGAASLGLTASKQHSLIANPLL
jgi:glucokinase